MCCRDGGGLRESVGCCWCDRRGVCSGEPKNWRTGQVGPRTEAIAAEGHIVTAGGVDTHIHYICPQQVPWSPKCFL